MAVDAIVNTANPKPVVGYGVDAGVHKKAGHELLAARRKIGRISVGGVAVTLGFGLDAKYIIHAVGRSGRMVKSMLAQCVKAASRVKGSYFSALYQRIAERYGKNWATMAVAHSMLIAIYNILKDGVQFRDLGADYFDGFHWEHKIRNYLKRLQALEWVPELPPATV